MFTGKIFKIEEKIKIQLFLFYRKKINENHDMCFITSVVREGVCMF